METRRVRHRPVEYDPKGNPSLTTVQSGKFYLFIFSEFLDHCSEAFVGAFQF